MLARYLNESVIIGGDIVITVLEIRGGKVRLGIAAPEEISVHRAETQERIDREQRQESEGSGS